MRLRSTFAALGLLSAMMIAPAQAQTAAGPPDWKDGASVYLAMGDKALAAEPQGMPQTANKPKQATPVAVANAEATLAPAENVQTAIATVDTNSRRLAPPSAARSSIGVNAQNNNTNGGARRLAQFGLPTRSLLTMASALAIAIGAFLLFAYALRKGSKRAGGGALPSDVVSVLGRVPIAARQFAELLRVGNKLVLVALTPNGPKTLTEVTDPAEVDRLVGLCNANSSHSTTKAFEQVFQQLASEPARGGFYGEDHLPASLADATSAYRSQRGAKTRA